MAGITHLLPHRFFLIVTLVLVLGQFRSVGATDAGIAASAGYEKEIKKKSDALDSIRTAIDDRRKKLRDLEKAEGNYLARLDYLQKNIDASRHYLSLLSARITETEATIATLTDSLHGAQTLLTDRQTVMRLRLRRAYMTGGTPPLIVLLLSKDPLDAINRVTYLEEVHRYDLNLVGKIDRTRQDIGAKKSSFEDEREKLAALLSDKKKENEMLLREEASHRTLISDIRSKKKANLAMIAELEATQNELNNIIRLLEQKRKKAVIRVVPGPRGTFDQQKGALPWPLGGPIVARFGKIVHPLYKTVTMNNGIDIGGRSGQEVRCVAAGTVIHTGAMRGLGKLVIVDHGGDVLTIYAQLAEIAVSPDQTIAAGSVIGTVGTGAMSENPGLHFEIRKAAASVDPLLWLEKKR